MPSTTPVPLPAPRAATPLRRPPPVDLLVAGVLAAVLLIVTPRLPDGEGGMAGSPIDAGALVLVAVAAGSLAFRRVAPRLTLAISTAAVVAYALADYVGGPVYLAPLVAVGTIASLDGRRAAVGPAVATTGVLLAAGLIHDRSYPSVLVHLLFLSWAVAAVLIGDTVRTRAQQLAALHERARVLEETREEEARRRVAEERVRIARDLHDVVAHSLASISIQAGTAAHVIDRRPDEARAALSAIRQASREALDELRATLDVLRDRDGGAPTSPTATLDALGGLVTAAEQAGVTVTVERDGLDGRRLPSPVDVTAYRIVQESLTNVMRHARADHAVIRLTGHEDNLEIEVTDDGRGVIASDPSAGAGHGIVGMRERATLLGGRLTAGPRTDGRGFRVAAVLPLPLADRTRSAGALHDETNGAPA